MHKGTKYSQTLGILDNDKNCVDIIFPSIR